MQSGIEILVKLILVGCLVLAGVAAWVVPQTRLMRQRQVSERLFVATQVVGLACGALGLVLIFAWPLRALEWHLWELAVMPYALVYVYWIIIMRRARRLDVIDEKQGLDMASACGATMGLAILAMFVAHALYGRGLFDARLFYPYFLLTTILALSATTLAFFKRS